ncbi:MAG: hypothetical protein INH37_24325 [Myxococcaceae bacterium]|nr:hypothetical protein [Myxococcaceae bacterium]
MPSLRVSWHVGAVFTFCCGGVLLGPEGGDAGEPASDAGSGFAGTRDGGADGIPCDVAALLRARCSSCHGSQPSGGAPSPLVSRADLLATAPAGGRYADRSLTRMKSVTAPMPPGAPLTAAELAPFEAWVVAGLPAGTCAVDAGAPPTPTCASNRFWADRYRGSGDMNPGMACRACHAGQNFNGQNPAGERELGRQYWFAGTAFPGKYERDGCLASAPAGVTVEILDADGGVRVSLPVRAGSGNFYDTSLRTRPQWLPYTARVKRNGVVVSTMRTPQMSGDCNTCHTGPDGQGGPGRITY